MRLRVNLLPHRAARRERQKRVFYALLGLSFFAGLALVALGWVLLEGGIARQQARNDFIAARNRELDSQIREIATLRQEIDALRARQRAVENLQADRAQPVLLFDQLNTQTPEGVFLRSVKQDGPKVVVSGLAASNERVSEFMRNLQNNSQFVTRPDLIESRTSAPSAAGGSQRRLVEFSMSFQMRSAASTEERPPAGGAPAPTKAAPRAAAREQGHG
jgi:type IV pilus assembly protein PilN